MTSRTRTRGRIRGLPARRGSPVRTTPRYGVGWKSLEAAREAHRRPTIRTARWPGEFCKNCEDERIFRGAREKWPPYNDFHGIDRLGVAVGHL
jgi:hypothetical protein